ncbi:MAG: hypothetical protein ACTSX6_10460 [Candidatus Heimdallarchaeaceae archaeon]
MVLFLVLGVFVGVFIRPTPKNQVLYIRERDGRGEEYDISKEDAVSLETKTNPPLRFFKYGRSYVFKVRSALGKVKTFARFFGKEGTAYTWRLLGFSGTKENPVKINLEFPSLEDAVKFRWGEEFYNTVPEEMKRKLQEDKVLVTVDLEPGIVPAGYQPITESVILNKADEDMASLIARGVKGAIKFGALNYIPWIGTGIAIGLALVGLGLIKLG